MLVILPVSTISMLPVFKKGEEYAILTTNVLYNIANRTHLCNFSFVFKL